MVGLVIIALITAIGIGIFTFEKPSNNTTLPTPLPTSEVRDIKSTYKDGIYEQLGAYMSPAGQEEIDVKLTLKNGIVIESVVTPKATAPISKAKQNAFAEGYKTSVVGKNINELQLGKIAGSSLTPKGFNDAVEKIKTLAKSS